jgi:hypothetical protein
MIPSAEASAQRLLVAQQAADAAGVLAVQGDQLDHGLDVELAGGDLLLDEGAQLALALQDIGYDVVDAAQHLDRLAVKAVVVAVVLSGRGADGRAAVEAVGGAAGRVTAADGPGPARMPVRVAVGAGARNAFRGHRR